MFVRYMSRVVINIVFIILLSLVIFPVKEASELLLAQQNNQTANNKDDDDDSDTTADFSKKIDFKLKFEFLSFEDVVYQPKEILIPTYIDFSVLLPLNHAAEVQTPPPNC